MSSIIKNEVLLICIQMKNTNFMNGMQAYEHITLRRLV